MARPQRRPRRTRPQGRIRTIQEPALEFDAAAYHILEAAATIVLHNLGQLDRGYVTKEDLISIGWERTFFYLKEPEEIHKKLFIWAQIAMARYVKDSFGPRTYTSIDPANEDDAALTIPSERELDDPAVAAAVLDALASLTPRERDLFYENVMRGVSAAALSRRRRQGRYWAQTIIRTAKAKLGRQAGPDGP